MSEQKTPKTEAALDGLTDLVVRQSRLIPADAFAKIRDRSRQLETDLAEAVAALSNIDLSKYVNAADISAADMPHVVVEKLQKAIRAKHK